MKFFVLLMALLGVNSRLTSASEILKIQEGFNQIAAHAKPAVVSIQVIREGYARITEPLPFFFWGEEMERIYRVPVKGLGSGIIIDPRGYVLTNEHVISKAEQIRVTTIGSDDKERIYHAQVIARYPELDIAVLKIKTKEKLSYLNLAYSSNLKIGDMVMAAGYPFGFKQAFTSGIISALNVSLNVNVRHYNSLIQTDAAINIGNSGGPLLNLDGDVIGINTAIMSPSGAFSGMGFAIPVSKLKNILDMVMADTVRKKGWLGVRLGAVDAVYTAVFSFPVQKGAIVQAVIKNSPAARAQIKRGDVIISIDGKRINSDEDLYKEIYSRNAGQEITIVFYRGNEKKDVTLNLDERPEDAELEDVYEYDEEIASAKTQEEKKEKSLADRISWEGIDFVVKPTEIQIEKINLDSKLRGFLQVADIVKGINQNKIRTYQELSQSLSKASLSEGVVFDLIREGEPMFISVQSK